jgi:hypothetical protein
MDEFDIGKATSVNSWQQDRAVLIRLSFTSDDEAMEWFDKFKAHISASDLRSWSFCEKQPDPPIASVKFQGGFNADGTPIKPSDLG